MDKVSEDRIKLINPVLADKVREMAKILEEEGITFRVVQGLRTNDEQQKLYDQGRSLPGRIVTNAKAGQSWHNFGLAVDVVPMNGKTPNWNDVASFERIIAVAESLGMKSGKSWRDQPHLQLTGRFSTSPNDEVRSLYASGGMNEVWKQSGIDVSSPKESVNA